MTTDVLTWPDCRKGSSVTVYRTNGGGHRYPGSQAGRFERAVSRLMGKPTQDFDAAALIWDYFKDKRR